MDNYFRQQDSNTQQPNGLLASLQIFNGILQWLTGLFQLTEEEQKDAGIYFGDERCKYNPGPHDNSNNHLLTINKEKIS